MKGIAGDGDEVGEPARLDRADVLRPFAAQERPAASGPLQRAAGITGRTMCDGRSGSWKTVFSATTSRRFSFRGSPVLGFT